MDINCKFIAIDDITQDFLISLSIRRKNAGLSRRQIEKTLALNRQTFYRYERAITTPNLGMFITLAKFFNADVSQSINYKYYHGLITRDYLQELKKQAGLSYPKIAEAIGYSTRSVISAFYADCNSSLLCLKALLDFFNNTRRINAK